MTGQATKEIPRLLYDQPFLGNAVQFLSVKVNENIPGNKKFSARDAKKSPTASNQKVCGQNYSKIQCLLQTSETNFGFVQA